jgi:hypothetical protein
MYIAVIHVLGCAVFAVLSPGMAAVAETSLALIIRWSACKFCFHDLEAESR